jgi:hypothetical protein
VSFLRFSRLGLREFVDLIEGQAARALAASGLFAYPEPGPGASVAPTSSLESLGHLRAGAWHFFFVNEIWQRRGFIESDA